MMYSVAAAALAFNAPVLRPAGAASALTMGVADMEGVGPETGGKVFDPLGLSKIASEETLAWYRACELKHSRIAMAAATAWASTATRRGPRRRRAARRRSLASLAFWRSS